MTKPRPDFSDKELKLMYECLIDNLLMIEQKLTDLRLTEPDNIAQLTYYVKKRHDIIGFLPVLKDYAD